MAIWFWIIAAWGLSFAALRNKKIGLEHLIWLLLPVDMYGIQIAGVTVKPYMLLCALLFGRMLLHQKLELSVKSRWSLVGGVVIVFLIVVNSFNNQTSRSFMAAVMLAVVWLCSMIYMNECGKNTLRDIADAVLASGIGFGTVFAVGYLFLQLNLVLPGILSSSRFQPGFFMYFTNMNNGQLIQVIRLRGFTIDPNAMIGTPMFCTIISLLRILRGTAGRREWAGLCLSVFCIVLSNSRMALICVAFISCITLMVGYKMAPRQIRDVIKVGLLSLVGLLLIISSTDLIPDAIKSILEAYDNRSGLNETYGRFSIWTDAVSVWTQRNLLWGVGFGQIQYYTTTARACHNTWLEFLCSSGLVAGTITLIYFTTVLLAGLRTAIRELRFSSSETTWTFVLGLLGVMIALIAVDNTTSSYLWFGASVVAGITEGCWRIENE